MFDWRNAIIDACGEIPGHIKDTLTSGNLINYFTGAMHVDFIATNSTPPLFGDCTNHKQCVSLCGYLCVLVARVFRTSNS